ncbi:MAG: exodeoxyribonuclease VII small subunit [Clostridiales bacterium]|nr:exodeoxyribonuclease VII small subunit [Clostridiales bacterium]
MKKVNLEKNLQELEDIFEKLEKENIPLSDSLKLFESGINIYRESIDEIDKIKNKITMLIDGTEEKMISGDDDE